MYKREYFCLNCGLFYWEKYPSPAICPNGDCESHTLEDGQSRWACDTMGFAYFSKDNSEYINQIGWSSLDFAHGSAVEYYRKSGLAIKS